MSVSVCLSVGWLVGCPFAHVQTLQNFQSKHVRPTYARGSVTSGDVTIRYVLPVLRITSHLLVIGQKTATHRPTYIHTHTNLYSAENREKESAALAQDD